MKAISLWAPWGTLLHIPVPPSDGGYVQVDPTHRVAARYVTPGEWPKVKRWETRSWPCPPSIIGQRVAFHQTVRTPPVTHLGDYWLSRDRNADWSIVRDGVKVADLSFGCIIATGIVRRSLRVYGRSDPAPWEPHIHNAEPGCLVLFDGAGPGQWQTSLLNDQRPFGDFTPGRYGWELVDVEPVTPPVPAKGRQGWWEWTPA